MKSLLGVLVAIIASLVVVGAVVFGFDDSTVLVPPPESVAESFVRNLVTHRYSQSHKYLSEGTKWRIPIDDLKRITTDLEASIGQVRDVKGGSHSQIAPDRARTSAILKTDRVESFVVDFSMIRRHGLWFIEDSAIFSENFF